MEISSLCQVSRPSWSSKHSGHTHTTVCHLLKSTHSLEPFYHLTPSHSRFPCFGTAAAQWPAVSTLHLGWTLQPAPLAPPYLQSSSFPPPIPWCPAERAPPPAAMHVALLTPEHSASLPPIARAYDIMLSACPPPPQENPSWYSWLSQYSHSEPLHLAEGKDPRDNV